MRAAEMLPSAEVSAVNAARLVQWKRRARVHARMGQRTHQRPKSGRYDAGSAPVESGRRAFVLISVV
jgi:hypothetical protein